HAELHNIVERIIGVVKRRFHILVVPPEYGMDIQAHIPPACCCLHNIIQKWDPVELEDVEREIMLAPLADELGEMYGTLADHIPTSVDRDVMSVVQDRIAQNIWASYAEEQQCRGYPVANLQGE
ncbi:hypothetical protein HYDPIDRAFT_91583, partial [Hydnomerulius pinastri MD-312]